MRRIMPLKIMGLTHQEEEEMKKMEKEEGMKEKNKEKAKLHHLNIPLLK